MTDKIKQIVTTVVMALFLFLLSLFCWLHQPVSTSNTERRLLAQFPNISVDAIFSTDFMQKFETYSLDQFPYRDQFRTLNAFSRFYLFQQKDHNGIYMVNGIASKLEYPLNSSSVVSAADKMNAIQQKYLSQHDSVYYAIIPDKNYFLAAQNGYPSLDYQALIQLMQQNLPNMQYIDIFPYLSIEDYYATDTHWRQEKITDVANKIATVMGFQDRLNTAFETHSVSPFYGVYYGQSALPLKAETIYYLTNTVIEQSLVYNYETNRQTAIYDMDKANGRDPYELFLSGATPLLTIENPNATSNKELIVFRDSFASSLVPLFTEAYQKITLIDIRYISSDLLDQFITFDPEQDVLFLYSTLILNNSSTLR